MSLAYGGDGVTSWREDSRSGAPLTRSKSGFRCVDSSAAQRAAVTIGWSLLLRFMDDPQRLSRSRTFRLPVNLMESMNLELTPSQQEILLRGLRFVRGAVSLSMPEFSEQVEVDRRRQYAEIDEVETLVSKAAIRQTAQA